MKNKIILALIGLIGFTIASRYIHIDGLPQFNALLATAAFMGFVIRDTKWAVTVAVGMMIVSDLFFGNYGFMMTVVNYAAIVAIVMMTSRMSDYNWRTVGISSVLAPVVFFLISNLGVFMFSQPAMYPMNGAGLVECYTMAIPFAKGTFIGTALYSALYFILYQKLFYSYLNKSKI